MLHARALGSVVLLTLTLGRDAPKDDLARLLRPRPGEAYVYRVLEGRPKPGPGSEIVVTAKSTGEQNAIDVTEMPRIAGLSLPEGTSVVPSKYVLRATGGQLTKTTPDGETTVVLREPLEVGTSGWSRAMRTHGPGGQRAEYRGPCRITAREQRIILGEERSTVTLACQIKAPDGELLLMEEYALDLGMVRWRTDFKIGGKSTGVQELVLEKIVLEGSSP